MTFAELVKAVGVGMAVLIQYKKGELTQDDIESIKTFDEWIEVNKRSPCRSDLEKLAYRKLLETTTTFEQRQTANEHNTMFNYYGFPDCKSTSHLAKEPELTLKQWQFIWEKLRCSDPHNADDLSLLAIERMIELSKK